MSLLSRFNESKRTINDNIDEPFNFGGPFEDFGGFANFSSFSSPKKQKPQVYINPNTNQHFKSIETLGVGRDAHVDKVELIKKLDDESKKKLDLTSENQTNSTKTKTTNQNEKEIENETENKNDEENIYALKRMEILNGLIPDVIKREIKLLSNLNNPNIIKLKDWFIDSNKSNFQFNGEEQFLCMLLPCYDTDLDKIIELYSPLPIKTIQCIFYQLLNGLSYLHDTMHIIHRDLKPNNIFINFKNNNIVIADFGCSKDLSILYQDTSTKTKNSENTENTENAENIVNIEITDTKNTHNNQENIISHFQTDSDFKLENNNDNDDNTNKSSNNQFQTDTETQPNTEIENEESISMINGNQNQNQNESENENENENENEIEESVSMMDATNQNQTFQDDGIVLPSPSFSSRSNNNNFAMIDDGPILYPHSISDEEKDNENDYISDYENENENKNNNYNDCKKQINNNNNKEIKYTGQVYNVAYRSPELLLGLKKYSYPIDIWALGCIIAQMCNEKGNVLFTKTKDFAQIFEIFEILGGPIGLDGIGLYGEFIQPDIKPLKQMKNILPYLYNNKNACHLMEKIFTYNPNDRITATDALKHSFFTEYEWIINNKFDSIKLIPDIDNDSDGSDDI